MKQANEIFQDTTPEIARSVFQFLRDEQRDVYRAAISSLAGIRRLRPVVIQRKSAADQIDWMLKNVKLRSASEAATQILQLWLLKAHTPVLIAFLDGLDIEHDGEGAAEDIPDELDPDKLKSTVTEMMKEHPLEIIRIYLHIFQLQRSTGWPELTALIESTPALQFGGPTPASSEATPADETAEGDDSSESED